MGWAVELVEQEVVFGTVAVVSSAVVLRGVGYTGQVHIVAQVVELDARGEVVGGYALNVCLSAGCRGFVEQG